LTRLWEIVWVCDEAHPDLLDRCVDRDAVQANQRRAENLVTVDRVVRARSATGANDLRFKWCICNETVLRGTTRTCGNGGAAQANRDIDIRDVNAEALEETGKRRVACGRHAGAARVRSREPDEPRGAGVATARIAREAATKSLESIFEVVVKVPYCLKSFVQVQLASWRRLAVGFDIVFVPPE